MLKKLFWSIFLVGIVFLLYSGVAFAENLYVTTSGTNGSGTSWTSPWVGFNNIQWGTGTGKVGAGDTLFIDGGIAASSKTYSGSLVIGASGAAGNLITITIDSSNSSHNGMVIIDLDYYPAKYGIDFGTNSYVKVDGYNTNQTASIGIKVTETDYSGVVMKSGASYNILRYVEQSLSTIDGIWLNRDGGHNLLEYCKIHDNKTANCHGVLLQSGDYNTLSHCDSYDNGGSGYHTYASSYDPVLNSADHITLEYCSGYRNGFANRDYFQHGVYICGPSSNCTVTNCTFYQNGGAGIQFFSASLERASTGNVASYNNCYDNGYTDTSNMGWGIVVAGFNNNADVQHNALNNNRCHGLSVWDTANGNFSNNTIYNNGLGFTGSPATDSDFTSTNSSSCTVNYNTYSELSNSAPLINWLGTVYSLSTAGSYKSISGKDANSTFQINTSPTPTPVPTPSPSPTPTPTPAASLGNYTVSYPAYSWTDAATTTTFSDYDEGNATIVLPFNFTFYGTQYDAGFEIKAFVNGGISFDPIRAGLSAASSYTTTWPSGGYYHKRVIAPWFQDMYSPTVRPAVIYTTTIGSAPNRVFVIAWKDMADAPGNPQVFEIKLFETTNLIEFHYQTLNFNRTHVPGINNGFEFQGFQVPDSYIGNNKAVRFTPGGGGIVKIDDKNSNVTYSGTWSDWNSSGRYDGSEKFNSAAGDYSQFTFAGKSISWIGSKSSNQGIADVYIDGVLDTTGVDTYASSYSDQQALFTKNWSTSGTHTIKIVATGTKNQSSSSTEVPVDAFFFTP